MVFVAQIDTQTQTLKQGLCFSSPEAAQAHFAAHPECFYVSVGGFVTPSTHQYTNGEILPI